MFDLLPGGFERPGFGQGTGPGFLNIGNPRIDGSSGLSGLSQAGGLIGLLGGPAGPIIGGLAGSALGALGGLIGGDGGLKKRRREAQAAFRDLLNSQIDPKFLNQSSALFERANLPQLQRLFARSAGRVGLDSGIGQGAALNQFSDLLARFNSQNLLNERNIVARNKRLGAQGLASLVG